jgi:orotidine-5'-phosphate decarboxylase
MKSPPTEPRDRLIVALDFPSAVQALSMAEQLAGTVGYFKIGLQLFTAAGPEIVRAMGATGAKVFLDLKLHDIPNTVAGAVRAADALGVQMLTVHLSGGRAMLEAAVAARTSAMMLLGVTVLTSANAETLRETGLADSVDDQVVRLAEIGARAGMDGLVASPHEVTRLRERLGHSVTIVTPGVRPAWSETNDQKRFMTPRQALECGADYLVIGRPITAQAEPRAAVQRILEEISA